jgi:regulator of protease activity HflC (stomatin/prohibitin superfamily)
MKWYKREAEREAIEAAAEAAAEAAEAERLALEQMEALPDMEPATRAFVLSGALGISYHYPFLPSLSRYLL